MDPKHFRRSRHSQSSGVKPAFVRPKSTIDLVSQFIAGFNEEADAERRDGLFHPRAFCLKYLKEQVLSKYSDGTSSDATFKAAMERFSLAEASCALTNQRFASKNRHHGDFDHAIQRAKVICSRILGESPRLDLIAAQFGWGPGASTRLPRKRGDAAYKYSGHPETTLSCLPYAVAAQGAHPAWTAVHPGLVFSVVTANMVTTVPKNSKTDRCIAVEPCMNMYIQKGFGSEIRHRLQRTGINLNSQTNNQDAAQAAYSDKLATIDLSMASDTVATYLVRELLPPQWYWHLDEVRCHYGVLPSGEVMQYQKFSSMGNGFTFELETLLFLALCRAVVPEELWHHVLIYGDDIVVPQEHAAEVIRLLAYCGFAVNMEKSFTSGPFYESCGKHYFEGHDVTPFYVRRPLKTVSDCYVFHNQITRWATRVGHLLCQNDLTHVKKFCYELRRRVSASQRLSIPEGMGDGGFVRPYKAIEYRRHPHGWCFYTVRNLVRIVELRSHEEDGLLVKAYDRMAERYRSDVRFFGPLYDKRYLQLYMQTLGIEEFIPLFPGDEYTVKYVKGSTLVDRDWYLHFEDLIPDPEVTQTPLLAEEPSSVTS